MAYLPAQPRAGVWMAHGAVADDLEGEMKVTGFRCDICGADFVAVQFASVPAPSKFSGRTEIPGQAGYSWDYPEICEACELEIRKAINTAIVGRKMEMSAK